MKPVHDVWINVAGGDQPHAPGRGRRHAWPHPRPIKLVPPQPVALVERLTGRQREVLELMARGWSNGAIARQLMISEKAVVQHTSQIYDRLDLFADDQTHRRVHAVLRYLAHAAAA